MQGNNKKDNSNKEKNESIYKKEINEFSNYIQNDISKLCKYFIHNKNENQKYDKNKIKTYHEINRSIFNNESIKRRLFSNRINR